MNVGWILGWAVPEEWFAPLAVAAMPRATHRFFAAGPDAVAHMQGCGPFDWVVGYSLGTLLLLDAEIQQPRPLAPAVGGGTRPEGASTGRTVDAASSRVFPKVALLAPIFALPLEAGMGGKVRRGQLRQLGRQLARDPITPVMDFYRYAGLGVPEAAVRSLDPEVLRWGIEQLEATSVSPPMPAGWRAWCGADDALLDAGRLCELDATVTVIPSATHHPAGLIRAFAQEAAA